MALEASIKFAANGDCTIAVKIDTDDPKAIIDLAAFVTETFRKVKQGKAWTQGRDRFGWLGDVRALEVTHGDNGWHPHIHALVFLKDWTDKDDAYGFGGWFFDRWAACMERAGHGICSISGFDFKRVDAATGTADSRTVFVCRSQDAPLPTVPSNILGSRHLSRRLASVG